MIQCFVSPKTLRLVKDSLQKIAQASGHPDPTRPIPTISRTNQNATITQTHQKFSSHKDASVKLTSSDDCLFISATPHYLGIASLNERRPWAWEITGHERFRPPAAILGLCPRLGRYCRHVQDKVRDEDLLDYVEATHGGPIPRSR